MKTIQIATRRNFLSWMALVMLAIGSAANLRAAVLIDESFHYALPSGRSMNDVQTTAAGLTGRYRLFNLNPKNISGSMVFSRSGLSFGHMAVSGGSLVFNAGTGPGGNAKLSLSAAISAATTAKVLYGAYLFETKSTGHYQATSAVIGPNGGADNHSLINPSGQAYARQHAVVGLDDNTSTGLRGSPIRAHRTFLVLFELQGLNRLPATLSEWMLTAAQYDHFAGHGILTRHVLNAASTGNSKHDVLQRNSYQIAAGSRPKLTNQYLSFFCFAGSQTGRDTMKFGDYRISDTSLAQAAPWRGKVQPHAGRPQSLQLRTERKVSLDPPHQLALPNIFANNMVVQADKPIHLWGVGKPAGELWVRMYGPNRQLVRHGHVNINARGQWSLFLPSLPASFTPYTLTVGGSSARRQSLKPTAQVTIHDVLVGEVWISAGQSNMDFSVQYMIGGPKLVASAHNPYIRNFCENVIGGGPPYSKPLFDVSGGRWFIADSPEGLTTMHVSAIGYSFASTLFAALNKAGRHVPVAVLNTATGDTNIRTWLSTGEINRVALLRRNARSNAVRRADLQLPFDATSALYNHKIAPLAGYEIRGILWLQGENDVGGADADAYYRVAMPSLIASWRKSFLAPHAPFIAGELSCFPYWDNPTCCAAMRYTQVQACRAAGNAVVISIYDLPLSWKTVPWRWQCTCHPEDKQPVGQRMARAALVMAYGQHIPYLGPTYSGLQIKRNTVDVAFKHINGGLKIRTPADGLRGFAICGKNRIFLPARAVIVGRHVQLTCKAVKHPVAVTYAFTDMCQSADLSNGLGLPSVPFRSDSVPSHYLPSMPWLHCRTLRMWFNNQHNAFWTKTWRSYHSMIASPSAAVVRFAVAAVARKIKGGAIAVNFSGVPTDHAALVAFGPRLQGLGVINLSYYKSLQLAVFNPSHHTMKLRLELATKVQIAKETLPWKKNASLRHARLVGAPGGTCVVPTGHRGAALCAVLSPGWNSVTFYLAKTATAVPGRHDSARRSLTHVHQILFMLRCPANTRSSHHYILLSNFQLF